MHDLELQPGFAGVPRDLEEAARIPRGQDTRPALPDAGDLHPPQLLGHGWLGQIVDARAPAAELGVLDVHQREAGNAAEKGARLGAYLLTMDEMAGVVIRDGEGKLTQREIRVHEDFRNVSRLVREARRSLGGEPMPVFLERRAAARGIGHDQFEIGRKAPHQLGRETAELVEAARMQVERSAAPLTTRHHHVPPRGGEEPSRPGVHVGEEEALHTAGEESCPAPRLAARRHEVGQRLRGGHGGEQRLHGLELAEGREQAEATHQRLRSRGLVELESPEERGEASGMREGLERPARRRMIGPRSADVLARELGPRRLQELAEGHAGGARRLAAAAPETEIEVTRERWGEPNPSLGGRAHEVDAAARRVHLLAQHSIGRALRQADAAVDAGAQAFRGRSVDGIEGAGGSHVHSPPAKRPRLRMPRGSNSALSRFITASAGSGTGPQTSAACFSSTGARSTTRLPPSEDRPSRSGDTTSLAQSCERTRPSTPARSTPLPASPTTAAVRPWWAQSFWSSPAQWDTRRISPASLTTMGASSAAVSPGQNSSSRADARPPAEPASVSRAAPCEATASGTLATDTATAASELSRPVRTRATPLSHATRSGSRSEASTAATKTAPWSREGNEKSHEPVAG